MFGSLHRLFGEGHRIFFLAALAYALVAMGLWTWWNAALALGADLPGLHVAPSPHIWHAHEMLFGYAGAAMGGFFLTAVPNWTGARAARHRFLAVAAALWLAGRLAMGFSAVLPAGVVALADLSFLPILAAKILSQLLLRPKPQNMMFLAVLALVWTGNLLMHLDWLGMTRAEPEGLRLGLLATCALIAILGGRVIPAFTRNAMLREGRETGLPKSRPWLDAMGIALALLLTIVTGLSAIWPAVTGMTLPSLAVAAGAVQLARLAGWQGKWTRHFPILWSLHAGFAALGVGYLAFGLSGWGMVPETVALHLLGLGAIGGTTLAVLSRATLGHGGRPLIAPRPVAMGYGLVFASLLARALAPFLTAGSYWAAILGAGALWLAAFASALVSLWPVLVGPRADGRTPA